MNPDLRNQLINAGVAFFATFVGVFLAQSLADSARRQSEIERFNSLYRVMAKDCQNALAAIRASRPQDRPVYLSSPNFLRFSLQENAVVLNQIDEDRMSRLLESIARTDELGNRYGDAAYRFEQTFPVFWSYDPPAPPPVSATLEERQAYDRNRMQFDRLIADRDAQLDGLRQLHTRYEDQIAATCGNFSETVQAR